MYQRCRRPAVHDDVESSVAEEDSDDSDGSEDTTDDGDLLFLDPEAAPKPPAVAAPGILLFPLISSILVLICWILLIQVFILSVNFTGKKSRGGVMYNTLARLGTPLVSREPRCWWSA